VPPCFQLFTAVVERLHGVRLRGLVGLGAEVGRGGALSLEEAGEDWLEHRVEDDLGTTVCWC